jgi:competence protein ComEC
VPAPGIALVVIYYGGLGTAVAVRRLRPAGVAIACLAAAGIATGTSWPGQRTAAPANEVRLTMIDVGQGESVLLEVAGAPPLLIDAGGAPFGSSGDEIGARVVTPALWARGVRTLGALLVTHGDPDHIGGASAVIRDFSPMRLWLGVTVPGHQPTQALIDQARRAHVATELLRSGTERPWGAVRLRVLNPPAPDWERRRVRNDDSVVLEVRAGDVSMLLTGDISGEVEQLLLPQLEPAPIRILKVAHHGSRTSSSAALLEAWRPQIAILSCGRGNRFGHPASEVLDRLHAVGARVYRTDLDGEVTVETDGKQAWVRAWMEARR